MADLLIIDKYTGEQCKYIETQVWYDNSTPMTNSLCDHVVYIQHEQKFYKRVLNDYITVKMFGAIGDGLTNDSEAIQNAVDFCEKTSQKTLFFPPGDYFLNVPIEISRGGLKFIGSETLLREESWWTGQQPHSPFSGCSLIIPKNSQALIFKSTVVDPVFIEAIQFLAKEGRTEGNTHAIDFRSEFGGPTWPFIIRDCHFRGFNRAVSFKSVNAYNVAFVQITGCAFSQNDECIYFDFADDDKQRNICWGFLFENNKCHDNSRVIYGYFAKDLVRIIDNNFEGSIPYSYDHNIPPNTGHYSVDLEISNCTVQFFGNHFETMTSNAVYISSLAKNKNGEYLPIQNTTALSNQNKVEITGNNMDGMASDNTIQYDLSGVQIINKDSTVLYVDACEIVENLSSVPNIFLNKNAKEKGTIIKFCSTENSAHLFNNMLENFTTVKVSSPKTLYNGEEQYDSFGNKDNTSPTFFNGGFSMTFKETPEYLGASFKVKQRLGNFVAEGFFNIFYLENNTVHALPEGPKYVKGMLSQKEGDNLFVLIVPNKSFYPVTSNLNAFSAGLTLYNLQEKNTLIATDITYFTINDDNPKILPYYQKLNVVEKVGTFEKGQTFVDTAGNFNIVKESGTIDSGNFLANVTVSGSSGKNYLDSVSNPEKFTIGQYIKIENLSEIYKIVGCKNGTIFYLNKNLPSTFSNAQIMFNPPIISII